MGITMKLKYEEIQPYIQLKLQWKKVYFKNDNKKAITKLFKFKDCTKADFEKTKYQQKYWDSMIKNY